MAWLSTREPGGGKFTPAVVPQKRSVKAKFKVDLAGTGHGKAVSVPEQQTLGCLLCFGYHLPALEEQYPKVHPKKLMDATFSEWVHVSDEIRRSYIKVAILPATVESEDILDALLRARAIFQKFHPMAKNLPAKLPELSVVDRMSRTKGNIQL